VADWVNDRPEPLVLRHHNITPAKYYAHWPGGNTYGMTWGRDQLAKLAPRAMLGLAASKFNAVELEELHYRRVETAPVLFDYAKLGGGDVNLRKGTGAQWLFVGWLAPHKCQHDIVKAFAMYRSQFDGDAHLHLVGRTGLESYEQACRSLAADSGLADAITLHGSVDDATLGSLYEQADLLVCMSEHEGVGLPLLEAMNNGLPVLAYSSAAVPETIGNAGLLLTEKDPMIVASAADRLVRDPQLRAELVSRGRSRIAQFDIEKSKARFVEAMSHAAEHADESSPTSAKGQGA
jgi:glycosyltransferase involved in cell wall biosynthesis